MTDMSDEYGTLRNEMLQLFQEQSQLAFVTGIGSAAVLFGLLDTSVPPGAGVAVWLLVLIGIARKLGGNYRRLYRIGSYIKVIHEQKGDPGYVPRITEPAWILRSRSIGSGGPGSWRWASGCQIDAGFLRLLGAGGIMFVGLRLLGTTLLSLEHTVTGLVSLIFFVFLIGETRRLGDTKSVCGAFEQEVIDRYASRTPSGDQKGQDARQAEQATAPCSESALRPPQG